MAATGIPYVHYTLNPGIYGCSSAGAGCDHCYAAVMARRMEGMQPGGPYTGLAVGGAWTGEVRLDPVATMLDRIVRVPHPRLARRGRVLVTSMGDILHEKVPLDLVATLVRQMALREDMDWLLLTKRAARWPEVARVISEQLPHWPANVWPGVTVWDQASADRNIPPLLQVAAAVRWVSAEPLLGPLDLQPFLTITWGIANEAGDPVVSPLDWVITGGESGPSGRPAQPDWFRSLLNQCSAAKVPFYFKGWGTWSPAYRDEQLTDEVVRDGAVPRVAGPWLDGEKYQEVPDAAA